MLQPHVKIGYQFAPQTAATISCASSPPSFVSPRLSVIFPFSELWTVNCKLSAPRKSFPYVSYAKTGGYPDAVIPILASAGTKGKGPLLMRSGPLSSKPHSHAWLCYTELLGRGRGGRLTGRGLLEFEREALAVGVDRGERARAVGVGGGAVGIFGVARGLLGYVSREGGNGLLTLQHGDLNVGSGAVPRDGVLAGVQRFAFDVDLFIELDRRLVGVSGDGGRRKQQRRAEKCEKKFREFHEIHFLSNYRGHAAKKNRRTARGRVSNSLVHDLTLEKIRSYKYHHRKNSKERIACSQ